MRLANRDRVLSPRKAAVAAALAVAAFAAGCSQSVSIAIPEAPRVPTSLTSDQQKKAVDDLIARRDQQEAETQQQAKVQR